MGARFEKHEQGAAVESLRAACAVGGPPMTARPAHQERVEASKRLTKAPPWTMELRGTQHCLFLDDVTLAALAAGYVTARLQMQARLCARYLEDGEA